MNMAWEALAALGLLLVQEMIKWLQERRRVRRMKCRACGTIGMYQMGFVHQLDAGPLPAGAYFLPGVGHAESPTSPPRPVAFPDGAHEHPTLEVPRQ